MMLLDQEGRPSAERPVQIKKCDWHVNQNDSSIQLEQKQFRQIAELMWSFCSECHEPNITILEVLAHFKERAEQLRRAWV